MARDNDADDDPFGNLSGKDRRRLRRRVRIIGLQMLKGSNGPVLLRHFSERLAISAGLRLPVNVERLGEAVKRLLMRGNNRRLRVIGPSMPGVGYIYDRNDPNTWPVVLMR